MSKKKYDTQLERIKRDNLSRERKRKLHEERMKYFPKFIMPSTSKIVLFVVLLLCVEVLSFCQYMIYITGDTNALYAMVTSLFVLLGTVIGYYMKSTKENTKGGIVYETAMAQIQPMTATSTTAEAVG